MVFCNLSVLLAERRLKISKVSADTGISRTTLTALCQNAGKGVQTDTINTLCMYLGVSVGDLFSFYPFDIELKECSYDEADHTAEITFSYTARHYEGDPCCRAEIEVSRTADDDYYAEIDLQEHDAATPEEERENELLRTAFKDLPISVVDGIFSRIADELIDQVVAASRVDVDGDPYGYPEDPSRWEYHVQLPRHWR